MRENAPGWPKTDRLDAVWLAGPGMLLLPSPMDGPGRDTFPSSTRRTRNAAVSAKRRAEAEVEA
jgi:hypothetical protein